jgi:hypothetical protein
MLQYNNINISYPFNLKYAWHIRGLYVYALINTILAFNRWLLDQCIRRCCVLVVRVPGYKSRDPGSIPRFSEK